jgi:hypothetical protein
LVLQENLLAMNLSTLIPEALRVGEYLQALLEHPPLSYESGIHRFSRSVARDTLELAQ